MCFFCHWGKPRNHRKLEHRRKLREKGLGVRVSGSRGWLKKHRPKDRCYRDCMCDLHEGVTDRKKSRAVANRSRDREIREQLQ